MGWQQEFTNYPHSVLRFENPQHDSPHPTAKPVAFLRYLIRTYTNPGDTVLDFTMGSGTTIVAAILEGRDAIGIELDPAYFAIAQRRCADAAAQPPLFPHTDLTHPPATGYAAIRLLWRVLAALAILALCAALIYAGLPELAAGGLVFAVLGGVVARPRREQKFRPETWKPASRV